MSFSDSIISTSAQKGFYDTTLWLLRGLIPEPSDKTMGLVAAGVGVVGVGVLLHTAVNSLRAPVNPVNRDQIEASNEMLRGEISDLKRKIQEVKQSL